MKNIFNDLDSILAAIQDDPYPRLLKEPIENKSGKKSEIFMMPENSQMYRDLAKQRSELVLKKLNQLFPDGDRIYEDFMTVKPELEMEVKKKEPFSQEECFNVIQKMLMDKDLIEKYKNLIHNKTDYYIIEDTENYLRNFAKSNNDKRIFKIGNILKVLSDNIENYNYVDDKGSTKEYKLKDLILVFNNRNTKLLKANNLRVCISKDPKDIAGMSSGQRWSSCMTLPGYHPKNTEGGKYYRRVRADVVAGTIVAYLIEGSKEAENLEDPKPWSRLVAKPFVLEKSDGKFNDMILINEKMTYHDGTVATHILEKFSDFFDDWLDKKQKPISTMGSYKRLTSIMLNVNGLQYEERLYTDNKEIQEHNLFDDSMIKTFDDVEKAIKNSKKLPKEFFNLKIVKDYLEQLSINKFIKLRFYINKKDFIELLKTKIQTEDDVKFLMEMEFDLEPFKDLDIVRNFLER